MKNIFLISVVFLLLASNAHAGMPPMNYADGVNKISDALSEEEEQALERLPHSNENICEALMPGGEKVVDFIKSKSPDIQTRFPLPDCKRSLKETIKYYIDYAKTQIRENMVEIKTAMHAFMHRMCVAISMCH